MRLIGPWCQANVGSYRFVLGQAYLACGEGQKVKQRSVTMSHQQEKKYSIIIHLVVIFFCTVLWPTAYVFIQLGSAVFPGGSPRSGEGRFSDEIDRL